MSPWAVKRLDEFDGDISASGGALMPSRLRQIAIAKTEPGDENNQDISSLVGKVDIRKLEMYAQNDPDAYSYSGGLNRANQGMLEFVEMFKAPIKMLHPLLTATQEGNYIGTENIGAMPFQGMILAHSNEAEWQTFKNNRNNEAFIDRIYVVKVPYCLRVTEEQRIYRKMLDGLRTGRRRPAPRHDRDAGPLLRAVAAEGAPELQPVRQDARLRRREHQGTGPAGAQRAGIPRRRGHRRGHGRHLDPLRVQGAGADLQPRHHRDRGRPGAPDVRAGEVAAPRAVPRRHRKALLEFIKSKLAPRYAEFIGNEIQKAYLESTATTARTCSTATSHMPTPGSRTWTSRTPTPGSC